VSSLSVRDADRTRLALAACVIVAGIAAIMAIAFAEGTTKDLDVYLLAGQRFAHGATIYGDHFGRSLTEPLPYTYPPVLAAVLSLVAWLPGGWVRVAWTVLDVVLLLWIVRVSYGDLLERLGPRWPVAGAAVAVLLGLSAPVLSVFDLGQVGIILVALVLADTLPARTRVPRGLLVGAATAVKLVPGLFIVYWTITKRWRPVAVAIATAVASWIVVAAIRPGTSKAYWLGAALHTERAGDASAVMDQSINGLLQRVGWTGDALWVVAAAAAIGIGLYRARLAHLAGDELAAVSLIGIATLLASPISWIHHAVWIVPATGVLLGDGTDRRRVVAWGATVALFLSNAPMLEHAGVSLGGPLRFLAENAFVIAYAALLLFLPVPARETPERTEVRRVCIPTPVTARR
jgi:alpha-1,2-mannosyltransferase